MENTPKKKYKYKTKAIQLPDGTRKFLRAKTQEELNEKVLKAQILVNSGVDICSEETLATLPRCGTIFTRNRTCVRAV